MWICVLIYLDIPDVLKGGIGFKREVVLIVNLFEIQPQIVGVIILLKLVVLTALLCLNSYDINEC